MVKIVGPQKLQWVRDKILHNLVQLTRLSNPIPDKRAAGLSRPRGYSGLVSVGDVGDVLRPLETLLISLGPAPTLALPHVQTVWTTKSWCTSRRELIKIMHSGGDHKFWMGWKEKVECQYNEGGREGKNLTGIQERIWSVQTAEPRSGCFG